MTNPDNVGGLPEGLEESIRNVADWANADGDEVGPETKHAMDVLRSQIRAYGELCRAAPAGGECQHEWQPDADVMNARYCPKCDVTQTLPRKQAKDSAPAGSGEIVTDAMVEAAVKAAGEIGGKGTHNSRRIMRAALNAALLRKLQQGAE